MKKLVYWSACLAMTSGLAHATLTGPVYPAPGGNSFSASGSSGYSGGRDNSYSGFDPTAYGLLYWGPTNVSTDGNGIGNVTSPSPNLSGYMTYFGSQTGSFSDLSLGATTQYIWTSTSPWAFNSPFYGNVSLPTRYVLEVTGATATTKSAAGIGSGNTLEPVFQVGGNFQANFVFEALFYGNWDPVLSLYNNINGGPGGVTTSASAGFWYSPVPTPEPGFYGVLLIGLIGLILFARRRLPN